MFDPLHKWLGIPPSEQPPNHYRLLGITVFEDDPEVIDAAADRQLTFLHDLTNGEHASQAEQLANQVSVARLCLQNEEKKQAYDEVLRGRHLSEQPLQNADVTGDAEYQIAEPPPVASALEKSDSSVAPTRSEEVSKRRKPRLWIYSLVPCAIAFAIIGFGLLKRTFVLDFSRLGAIAETITPEESPDVGPTESVLSEGTDSKDHSKSMLDAPSEASSPSTDDTVSDKSSIVDELASGIDSSPSRSLRDLMHGNDTSDPAEVPRAEHLPITKLPLPSESEIDEKMELIAELYHEEYEKAKTASERIKLGKLMHREGQNTNDDPSGRYALWRVARNILAMEGEYQLALGVVDNFHDHYVGVDAVRLRAKTLEDSAAHIAKSRINEFVDDLIQVAQSCCREDRFDLSGKLFAVAKREVGSGLSDAKREELASAEQEAVAIETAYQDYVEGIGILKSSPGDPQANQQVGRYLCFFRGDWENGLPNLALCEHEQTRVVAKRELASALELDRAIEIANAWYDIANQTQAGLEQTNLYQHALDWYEQAKSESKGLERKKTEVRIAELQSRLPLETSNEGAALASGYGILAYRKKTSPESRSDFSDRRGNVFHLGMGARPDGRGEAIAGIELQGVKKIHVEGSATHDIQNVDDFSKAGFIIDYHTPGGYARRVFLGFGLRPGRKFTDSPNWGTGIKPNLVTDIGRSSAYDIDLARWAPSTWDGRCWFSIYIQNAGPNRALNATLTW